MRRLQLCRSRVRQWSAVDEAGEVLYSSEYPYRAALVVVLEAEPEDREHVASECAALISSSLGHPLDYVREALDDEVAAFRALFTVIEFRW